MEPLREPRAQNSPSDQTPIESAQSGTAPTSVLDEEDLHILCAALALQSRCPVSKANDGEAANAAVTQDAVGHRA